MITTLNIPDKNISITNFSEIQSFLKKRGIDFERWEASIELSENDSQEKVLSAYQHKIHPLMEEKNYKSADVINVHPGTPQIETIRQKFLSEHTHSEDEVRFFVDGSGTFWFHHQGEVFNILCTKGDFLSVPAGFTHWFDLAPQYFVKAIRIFTGPEGWVAHYTQSGVDKKYNP